MAHRTKNCKPGGLVVSTIAPKAEHVFVAATFNNWNPSSHPLNRTGDGHWAATLDLPPGRHEYMFVVDGRWCCEAGSDEPAHICLGCVPNGLGTMNRVVEIG